MKSIVGKETHEVITFASIKNGFLQQVLLKQQLVILANQKWLPILARLPILIYIAETNSFPRLCWLILEPWKPL